MCGIAGILDTQGRDVDRGALSRICDCLCHRGPDDEGYHVERSVGLGQRRLSIIDLAHGQQPMPNEDESVWMTFNGEIYNYQSVRAELKQLGHEFRTESDTEVVIHAWEQWGRRCVEHFRGMFAFGLWDRNRQTLFLARDRVGKKPLFYAQVDGRFVFASELRALVEHPDVPREMDVLSLDDYLTYGYIPAPRTIFENVYKLEPGHTMTIQLRQGAPAAIEIERYWDLAYAPKLDVSEDEAADALLETLREAVRLRMIADVPLGALLSGGIDSSLVVALMSQLSDQPVRTFSIGFSEREYNELPFARRVAEMYGTQHHELIVEPHAMDILPLLVAHYGEPFADSSAVPSYYVAKMTREHVKVALNGDGGDESFAGYDRYLGFGVAEKYGRVPAIVRRGLVEPASRLIPDTLPARNRLRQAKRFLEVATQAPAFRYSRWMSLMPDATKQELYTSELKARLGGREPYAFLREQYGALADRGLDNVDRLLALDVRTYLPHDLLVKMDIASMAASLEARSPFLDHEVMELAARLPSQYKLKGRTLKYLLKKIGGGLLPPENLHRRKMGFGVPVADWLRGEMRPLLEDTLLSTSGPVRGYFKAEPLRRMVQDHVSGAANHAFPLWALIWLELWHRQFIDSHTDAAVCAAGKIA